LSVFVGGFTLEAADAVCSEELFTPRAVLDLMARLVDRSLIRVEREREYERFGMLETIREYAREKLDESGEKEQLRRRHRDFFIAFAERAEPKLKGREQSEWLDRLEVDHDNLRAAWDCTIESDAGLALRLASALLDFWSMRGNLSEGRQWLAQLLERTSQWGQTAKRAHALGVAGRLAYLQGDFAAARRLLEEALAIARITGDKKEIAFALLWLGWTAHHQHDNDQIAQALSEECLTLYQELQDEWGIAMALYHLAGGAADQGHSAEAEERYMQSLAKFRELGDKFRMGYVLNGLGELARLEGNYEQAGKFYDEHIEILREQRAYVALIISLLNQAWVLLHRGDCGKAKAMFEECLKLSRESGHQIAILVCLTGFAGIMGMTGKSEEAARLFGAAEALFEAIGIGGRRDPADQKEFDQYVAVVRGQLDTATFAKAWTVGRALTLEQAVEFGLEATQATP
jgi:tetratricopeptide (TPR) repeat protein